MKKLPTPLLLFLAFNILSACSKGQTQDSLSASEFAIMIEKDSLANVIDVRTPEEFRKGHLSNAKNIDWKDSAFTTRIQSLDPSKTVFVYCLSGGRSAAAAESMRAAGFHKVYELKGGITQWRNAGLPEVKDSSASIGLDMESFKLSLQTDKIVVVNFYAPWCMPCKKMEPELIALEQKYKDKILLKRINADDNQYLLKKMNISAIPTLLMYKNQKVIWKREGYVTQEDLEKQLQ